jgi:hypothetical protein
VGYLQSLLLADGPLMKSDVSALRSWLGRLREDCETFGAAGEDEQKMQAIKARLEKEDGK